MNPIPHVHVAIVGSGIAGMAAAVRLREAGVESFAVLERADGVGGVWRANRYPGAACDIPAHLYALSFAPNPHWSRHYARQPEILAYLERLAEREGLGPYLRLGCTVERAAWDEAAGHWHLDTSTGALTATALVAAPGGLAEPRLPDLPGLETFAGPALHTARWDPAVPLDGRRVAVVGTGASAVQVIPEIAPRVARLTVFQRTPAWVVPRHDRAIPLPARLLLARVPGLRQALRGAIYAEHEARAPAFLFPRVAGPVGEAIARRHLRRQVADPGLRARLTPDYAIGCKRVLVSDDYYPALAQPAVEVVAGGAAEVRPHGVVGADGVERPADVLVLATGFHATDFPFAHRLVGRGGRTLADVWGSSPRAHVSTTVAGFPNLFVMSGPNTGLGHNSVVLMIEAQVAHAVAAIRAGQRAGAAVEPHPWAQAAYVADVDRGLEGTVWASGCDSWYLDASGRAVAIWPGSPASFRRRVAPFDAREYRFLPLSGALAEVPPPRAPRRRLADAALGALVRRLDALPEGVRLALAPGPPPTDGAHTLDATLHVMATRRPPGPDDRLTAGTPDDARVRFRREVLGLRGRVQPVGGVRNLEVDGADGPLAARHYAPDGDRPGRGIPSGDGAAERPPLLVYFHGGGYVLGDLDTADETCRMLCAYGHQHVLSVAYRLAPEHPAPAAILDGVAALRWAQAWAGRLGADPARVGVGGDSAGAALAFQTAVRTRGERPPAAQLLIYPSADMAAAYPSNERFSEGLFLSRADRDAFARLYAGGLPRTAPEVSPLFTPDLSGLAPALVWLAGFDVLVDEGEALARAMAAAGTPVDVRRAPRLAHGFVQMAGVSRAAHAATAEIGRTWRAWLGRHVRAGAQTVGAP